MKLPQTLLEKKHFPVMLNEVLKICLNKSGGIYLDCTFGGGGYSRAILMSCSQHSANLDCVLFTQKNFLVNNLCK